MFRKFRTNILCVIALHTWLINNNLLSRTWQNGCNKSKSSAPSLPAVPQVRNKFWLDTINLHRMTRPVPSRKTPPTSSREAPVCSVCTNLRLSSGQNLIPPKKSKTRTEPQSDFWINIWPELLSPSPNNFETNPACVHSCQEWKANSTSAPTTRHRNIGFSLVQYIPNEQNLNSVFHHGFRLFTEWDPKGFFVVPSRNPQLKLWSKMIGFRECKGTFIHAWSYVGCISWTLHPKESHFLVTNRIFHVQWTSK